MSDKNQKLYTEADKLRFRKTPDTKNLKNLIRELKKDQEVELLDGPWLKVRIGRTEGWIHGDYVTEEKPAGKKISKGARSIEFKKGIPHLVNDEITKVIREIIDDEFNLGKAGYNLNCTEYVQYCVKEKLGIDIDWPVKSGRNGGKWASIFKKYNKYKILGQPKTNCAICFTDGISSDSKINEVGHVAFVEKVCPNGTVSISEANWPRNGIYNERSIPKEKWKNQYKAQFIEFGIVPKVKISYIKK